MSSLKVGTIVTGEVIAVYDTIAYVSVGGKSEGQIHLDHYTSNKDVQSLKELVKEGDSVRAIVSKVTDSVILLSRLELEESEKRAKIIKKIMNRKPFTANVKAKNKNNEYVLDKDGISCYLPENYVDLNPEFDKDSIIGTEVKVMFAKSETDERGKQRIIVTRKQVQYNEQRNAKEEELASINVDDVLKGTVSKITDFGAFIKFNAIEGLCHLTEISHYHIKNASECLSEGQEVEVKVIKKTESKIHLSIKALEKTPWEIFLESHKVGDKVEGTIIKKGEKYMLVEIEREIVGILNQSDYSWNRDENFAGSVQEGDKVELQITYIDKEKNKMTLSKKHLQYNPWQDTHIRVREDVTGTVERFTNTGAIIKVGEVEGFLPNNQVSEEDGKDAQQVLKIGDVITARVTACRPERWLLTLSIRAIEEEKTRKFVEKYIDENVDTSSSLSDMFQDFEIEE